MLIFTCDYLVFRAGYGSSKDVSMYSSLGRSIYNEPKQKYLHLPTSPRSDTGEHTYCGEVVQEAAETKQERKEQETRTEL